MQITTQLRLKTGVTLSTITIMTTDTPIDVSVKELFSVIEKLPVYDYNQYPGLFGGQLSKKVQQLLAEGGVVVQKTYSNRDKTSRDEIMLVAKRALVCGRTNTHKISYILEVRNHSD